MIPILTACLTSCISIGLFVAYRRTRRLFFTVERHIIRQAGGAVPTIDIEQDPPAEVRIGNKRLMVQPLSIYTRRIWLREIVRFLKGFASDFVGIQIEETNYNADKKKFKQLQEIIQRKAYDKVFLAAIKRLFAKTVLSDKRNNPERITSRYMMRHLSVDAITAIFWTLYAYNNGGHLKKNCLAIMEAILQMQITTTDIRSLWPKNQGLTQQNILNSHFRGSPFVQELEQS